ncbi:MAG: hypothetical protein AB8I08_13620 [Sandaracinaceae bacterium]
MSAPFPAALAQLPQVEDWWSRLDPAIERELTELTAPEWDDVTLQRVGARWEALPLRVVAQFADPEDERDHERAIRDLTEYINGHPNRPFYLRQRTFHICRAHARARRVIAEGWIPAGFRCPIACAACPFVSALSTHPGKALRLRLLRRDGQSTRDASFRIPPPSVE